MKNKIRNGGSFMELSEIIKKMKNGESLYGLIANDYYKMSKETIKDILLDAIYLLDNDKKILAEMEAREYNLLDEISENDNLFCDNTGYCKGHFCSNYNNCKL